MTIYSLGIFFFRKKKKKKTLAMPLSLCCSDKCLTIRSGLEVGGLIYNVC